MYLLYCTVLVFLDTCGKIACDESSLLHLLTSTSNTLLFPPKKCFFICLYNYLTSSFSLSPRSSSSSVASQPFATMYFSLTLACHWRGEAEIDLPLPLLPASGEPHESPQAAAVQFHHLLPPSSSLHSTRSSSSSKPPASTATHLCACRTSPPRSSIKQRQQQQLAAASRNSTPTGSPAAAAARCRRYHR